MWQGIQEMSICCLQCDSYGDFGGDEELEAPLNIRHYTAALLKQGAISSTLPSALPSESQL